MVCTEAGASASNAIRLAIKCGGIDYQETVAGLQSSICHLFRPQREKRRPPPSQFRHPCDGLGLEDLREGIYSALGRISGTPSSIPCGER
jgi:hypothetical protein